MKLAEFFKHFKEEFENVHVEKLKSLLDDALTHTTTHLEEIVEIDKSVEFGFGLILNEEPYLDGITNGNAELQSYGILMTLSLSVSFLGTNDDITMNIVIPVPSVEHWLGFLGEHPEFFTKAILNKIMEDSKDKPLQ